MVEATSSWTFVRRRNYRALRTGVAAAAASVGPSFARGLLPRSTADQAIVTGAAAAYWLGVASLGLSSAEAVAELVVKSRRAGSPENTTLLGCAVVGLGAASVVVAVPETHDVPLPLAAVRSAAWITAGGAIASGLVIGTDKVLRRTVGEPRLPVAVGLAVALGGAASGVRVGMRNMRARRHQQGRVRDRRPTPVDRDPRSLARSAAVGAATTAGLVGLAAAHFAVAEGSTALASRLQGRPDRPVTPLVGHAVSAGVLTVAAAVALNRVRWHTLRADDIVEPAYPDPPTSPHVTAGPNSVVPFDAIGKEGRRFVLMALEPDEITAVMGEPATAPVRVVAGFASAQRIEDRVEIALSELERLGGFERSTIVVAAPTGVGYVNYSFAEAVEYLTRGDCAIVVPQYALMPSALSLHLTRDGERQQRLVLERVRDRIASMPPETRPRVLHFGESLGAEVALDVAASGTHRFAELGLDAGLYLGTPFRTELWERWLTDPDAVDRQGLLGQVSQASEIPSLPLSVRHVQVIHDDDPITKFDAWMGIRPPRWMGPPETRPAGVPRETAWRPVITLIIALVDLKNGMNSKPGAFVRRGHDYRIELAEAVHHVYRLPATPEQLAAIEGALRAREQLWATRRMIATRFSRARNAVREQLSRWGSEPDLDLDELTAAALARGDMGPRRTAGASSPDPALLEPSVPEEPSRAAEPADLAQPWLMPVVNVRDAWNR